MNWTKRVAGLLCVVIILTLSLSLSAFAYNDGTYTGEGKGLFGPIKVEVKVENGKIAEIKVLEHGETPGLSDAAFNNVIPAIIEEQSFDVDLATGATFTSKGIIAAVKDALDVK